MDRKQTPQGNAHNATTVIDSFLRDQFRQNDVLTDDGESKEHRHGDSITTDNATDSEKDNEKKGLGQDLSDLYKSPTRTFGKLKMRGQSDHDPTDWWFASTAIPLIAATLAPMANLLSIAALVAFWRNEIKYPGDTLRKYSEGIPIEDPKWCYDLNAVSLACGFAGNLFLLFNFTQRVRYIVALPVTIFFFYLASGILIGIVVSMDQRDPPSPTQVYSQAYWHAVIAACLYMLNSMILMVNMLGYFLGHYPQHFTLSIEQRNLILQTMLFFIWLGGGAAVFAHIEDWFYADALYFCDVTILTIGFGDYYAQNDLGKGLVFPFSVGGTIILGLMVNSIHKFAKELSKEKVVRKHIEQRRVNTLSRAVTIEQLDDKNLKLLAEGKPLTISSPLLNDKEQVQSRLDELVRQEQEKRGLTGFRVDEKETENAAPTPFSENLSPSTKSPEKVLRQEGFQRTLRSITFPITKPVSLTTQGLRRVRSRNQKKILMIEERDRFNAMRKVQTNASRFKRYYALSMSIISFGLLWCLGAMVFYFAESETQNLSYFQGLYFCYVSLLTIGYGDLSPKSNAGKSFFVVWSLIAVPTMTILVSDLGDTVIGGFKRGVLENDLGLTSSNDSNGQITTFVWKLFHSASRRQDADVDTQGISGKRLEDDEQKMTDLQEDNDDGDAVMHNMPKTIDELVEEEESNLDILKNLASAIRQAADDLKNHPGKRYRYEEWVEFSRLIRFSKNQSRSSGNASVDFDDEDDTHDGIVDWDWLDERSPMTSEQSESEWVLERLCDSLFRVFKQKDLVASILAQSLRADQPGSLHHSHQYAISPSPAGGARTKFNDSAHSADIDTNEPHEPSAMNRLLHGESSSSGLKWSKRAHARRVQVSKSMERRRASTVTRRKKHDSSISPSSHINHGIGSIAKGSQPERAPRGLGIEEDPAQS